MSDFAIQLPDPGSAVPDEPCRIRITAGDIVFTRLLREPDHRPDEALVADPVPLAFWLCDNWWRLRWETMPPLGPTIPWRRAHDLASVGGGYTWPRLCLWGDLDRMTLLSRSDPVGVMGPVRYLTDAIAYVDAPTFEMAVDDFLDRVADEQHGFGSDREALRALISALRSERIDEDVTRWRRIEARLGYDPDAGPDALIAATDALADRFGLESVEEALAATPGAEACTILDRELSLAREQGQPCDFSAVLADIPPIARNTREPPWIAAEIAASRVRALAGIDRGPLHNRRLADLLGTTAKVFQGPTGHVNRAYGLRLAEDGAAAPQSVSLRSRWAHGRRFELCRALGDALWSREAPIGPLAVTSTARQQFQRAFAQSLLCPFDELREFLGTDHPDDDDIAAAASHFHVADRVVQSLLVNKAVIERARFADWLELEAA
jgi:hypothetical protein